ncbi:conserved Plasmodium protein, unknown function [Plasmodium malariae]|uniref:DNA polymerase delta subunit 3 n=1 Tax=Plasmodium malariae TaxID=5858 RepID=A0A1C3KDE6_PLAMA|nr:conserved Plasmodium protein, unknown function [Plasmodium malariae]
MQSANNISNIEELLFFFDTLINDGYVVTIFFIKHVLKLSSKLSQKLIQYYFEKRRNELHATYMVEGYQEDRTEYICAIKNEQDILKVHKQGNFNVKIYSVQSNKNKSDLSVLWKQELNEISKLLEKKDFKSQKGIPRNCKFTYVYIYRSFSTELDKEKVYNNELQSNAINSTPQIKKEVRNDAQNDDKQIAQGNISEIEGITKVNVLNEKIYKKEINCIKYKRSDKNNNDIDIIRAHNNEICCYYDNKKEGKIQDSNEQDVEKDKHNTLNTHDDEHNEWKSFSPHKRQGNNTKDDDVNNLKEKISTSKKTKTNNDIYPFKVKRENVVSGSVYNKEKQAIYEENVNSSNVPKINHSERNTPVKNSLDKKETGKRKKVPSEQADEEKVKETLVETSENSKKAMLFESDSNENNDERKTVKEDEVAMNVLKRVKLGKGTELFYENGYLVTLDKEIPTNEIYSKPDIDKCKENVKESSPYRNKSPRALQQTLLT